MRRRRIIGAVLMLVLLAGIAVRLGHAGTALTSPPVHYTPGVAHYSV